MALTSRATRAAMAHTEGSKLAIVSESQKCVVVRIESATRLHEVGIASNRGSECHGEYVPGLVHTARHTMGVGCKEVGSLTFGRTLTTLWFMISEVVTR